MADAPTQSSIRVRYEEHRSVANAAAQHIAKPFASLILRPGSEEPVGSPRLTPHKNAQKRCKIQESQIADTWIYTFKNPLEPEPHVEAKHKLYYFAGGGFRGVPEKEHWVFCAELCTKLPEYEINLISYPLAPNSPAAKSLAHLELLYKAIAQQSRKQNFRITLMGDSSGGNIVLVLGLYAASEYLKDPSQGPCPVEAIMAMSPATDLRNENPDIDAVDPHDPILSRKTIEEVAHGWKGDMSFSDPRLSPVLADLSLFRRAGIKVDGVIAGNDVLTPDAIVFRKKLAEYGVEGDWLEWEKQMHCFPLLFAFHVREGIGGKDWILDILRTNAKSVITFPTTEV
jgi:acetyl esterase/lipase